MAELMEDVSASRAPHQHLGNHEYRFASVAFAEPQMDSDDRRNSPNEKSVAVQHTANVVAVSQKVNRKCSNFFNLCMTPVTPRQKAVIFFSLVGSFFSNHVFSHTVDVPI